MKEAYTYRGHSIALNLSPIEHGRVRWTYFIDEDYCIQDTSDSLPIEAVRINALALAHRSIDALDAIVSFGMRPAALNAAGRIADSNADRVNAVPSMRALHSDPTKRSFSR